MKEIYSNSGYVADPHGAVGYLGLQKYGLNENQYGVFLETAHPVKFLDVVEKAIKKKVSIPLRNDFISNKVRPSSIRHTLYAAAALLGLV